MNLNFDSGILMHVTSLPSRYGVGEFGRPVVQWLDDLAAMGQSIWQVLPLGPTGYGDSPYQSPSAFAGNPMLIGIELLCEDGWLTKTEARPLEELPSTRVDYERLIPIKCALLRTAARRFLAAPADESAREAFRRFCAAERSWLDDFAVFAALKDRESQRPWWDWPAEFRDYTAGNVERARAALAEVIAEKKVLQFFFHHQWSAMRRAAAERGIRILGDIPIFVAHDSAEVWSDRRLFLLDESGQPTVVAGVPPDYFSATGQRWGNPLYDWPEHRRTRFAWWERRLGRALELQDWVRVDHFRGFVDYWEIPADEPLAIKGQWRPSPGRELFEAMRRRFGGGLPIVAEDLGVLSEEVAALREAFGFPGMRILQFAFGTDPLAHTFLPEVYVPECVAYTGTHDNDTVAGWFHDKGGGSLRSAEQCEKERRFCLSHLGIPGREIHWEMIEVLLRSKAGVVMFPLQDVLGLGSEGRMNVPGTTSGNWRWRLETGLLTGRIKERLRDATVRAGRNRTCMPLRSRRGEEKEQRPSSKWSVFLEEAKGLVARRVVTGDGLSCGPVPLTPALSPGEREGRSPLCDGASPFRFDDVLLMKRVFRGTCSRDARNPIPDHLVLPLPEGEGRGEGEGELECLGMAWIAQEPRQANSTYRFKRFTWSHFWSNFSSLSALLVALIDCLRVRLLTSSATLFDRVLWRGHRA